MNGKDIIWSLRHVSDDVIEEAEYGSFPLKAEGTEPKHNFHRIFRRPFLIAAIIAMMLLLVGCAVVYMLSLKEIKLGEQQTSYDSFSYDPDTGVPVEYLGKANITEQVLSFAGMRDTPAFQAAQEWFDFKQTYDPNGEIQASVWGNEPEFPAEYNGYGLYTQEMKDKLDELLQKYALKLRGANVPFRTTKQLLRAMGMETILRSGSQGETQVTQAEYYENGNLDLIFFLQLPGEEPIENTFCCLYYRQKDCLIDDFATINADSDWREWNYTTASQNDVLIVRAPDSYVWVFCDTGNTTATLRLENSLTDRQVELAADAIDFSLEPKLLDGYETIDDGALGSGEEINGYSVKLKSAQTDGYSVYILMSVTAPEGADLEGISVGELSFQLMDTEVTSYSGCANKIDDGDGLANTCDILLQRSFETEDGSAAITKDTIANIYFEDLYERYWDEYEHENLISEGVWSFDITFEDSDFREIELLSQPITAKAVVGWDMEGNDVIEAFEVTSVKLRSLSIDLVCENQNADFFSFTGIRSYAVMKDGSKVEIMNKVFVEPIDLDQVDHILLADGTKLPVTPQTE